MIREAGAMREQTRPVGEATDYTRFVILSGARTGSTVLAQALNSSPDIICFREVFNYTLHAIDYSVAGYDNGSAEDLALRARDPIGFLRERIFCRHPDEVRAVGFKFHYLHFWGFPGLWEALAEDQQLRVLHLKRLNLLRMLLSLRIAESTGVWQKEPGRPLARAAGLADEAKRKLTPANVWRAFREPGTAAAWLRRLVHPPEIHKTAPRAPVIITEDEFRTFVFETESTSDHFDDLFREHPKLTLSFEDLLKDNAATFNRAQEFLGAEPKPLTVTLRRQNPEPLRELLQNYDELWEALRSTPHAWMFE